MITSKKIFTARKRSLGQSNVFIGACLSTRGGSVPTWGSASGVCLEGLPQGGPACWGGALHLGVCIQGVLPGESS